MKSIIIYTVVLISFLFFGGNSLKKSFKLTLKGKCERAEKYFHRINASERAELPLTFLLQHALFYEKCKELQDSACFYYCLSLNQYRNVSDKETKFLNSYKIDRTWIENKINAIGCDLSIEKFIRHFKKNLNFSSDSLTHYLMSSQENKDSLIAPSCFYLCKGIHYEFVLKNRKEACRYYKLFDDIDERTNYDLRIININEELLTKRFLNKRLDCCKYYCQIIIDNLNDSSECGDYEYMMENLKLSIQHNEDNSFPIAYLFAEGRFAQFCQNDLDKACRTYIKTFHKIKDDTPDWLYDKTYKYEILSVISEFTKNQNCIGAIISRIKSPLVDLRERIIELGDTVKKYCAITTKNSVVRPGFQAEIIDSISLKLRFYYNADVWAFHDSIGLGEYKTPIIDTLILKMSHCLNDFLFPFDTVNLETYILGIADGTPIGGRRYLGELSDFTTPFFYGDLDLIDKHDGSWYNDKTNREWAVLEVNQEISDVELAILRAYNVKLMLEGRIQIKNGGSNTAIYAYDYPDVSENKNYEYRRLEIVFIMRNVLNHMKKDYEFREKMVGNWDETQQEMNEEMKKFLTEIKEKNKR